ncbi:MAG: rRNA (cytidine-2'-O-)-methyltransferase, partial [Pseudomonadota bacterium]
RFFFAGFAPPTTSKLESFLDGLAGIDATLIIYEVPRRLKPFLETSARILGADRPAAVCRELTKRFEDVRRMPLADLAQDADNMVLKGECVVVVDRPISVPSDAASVADALQNAMNEMSFKDAVKVVTEATGMPRREVYQIGLGLEKPNNRR